MKKKGGKVLLVVALILFLISMIGSSLIQNDFGKVKVSELRLVDCAGYEVSVLLYKPNTATEENKAPCVITIEGWYNNKEMQDLYSVELARRGYVVIATDMHGHGDSEATDADNLFTAGVGTDAAVELAASLPYVDATRIGMTGHSSGASAGINEEIQLDNTKDVHLVKAALLQSSLWFSDAGVDVIHEYGEERSIGLIAAKYDEFYYWTDPEDGTPIKPRDFLTTKGAQRFINFGDDGYEGITVTSGEIVGRETAAGTTYRAIFQNNSTHPRVHFSIASVNFALKFFDKALGTPNPIDPANQVWPVKTAFNFLGLVAVCLFIVGFIRWAVTKPYFAELKADSDYVPAKLEGGKSTLLYLGLLALGAVVSGVTFKICIDHIYSKTTPFFPQTGPLTLGAWSAINGIYALIVLFIFAKTAGKKNGFNAREAGIFMSGKKLWKTIVLALLTSGLIFLILFFADYFFRTDFRLWVLTLKAFDADKVWIGLRFLPFFLCFYIINSISANCFNWNTFGGKLNTLIFGLFNAAGAIVYALIQYITFFTTGLAKWYATEGQMISGIWTYCPIVFLIVT
ncbi:MAG: hypothetical protein IKD62_05280, partial [Oscillospiraceae bacterium]|nr:hypothetical protein [Oscillospiraceae bacterium]